MFITSHSSIILEKYQDEWAQQIMSKLKDFLTNDKRIPRYLTNPKMESNKECVFQLDMNQYNLRRREREVMIAMLNRMQDVLNAHVSYLQRYSQNF